MSQRLRIRQRQVLEFEIWIRIMGSSFEEKGDLETGAVIENPVNPEHIAWEVEPQDRCRSGFGYGSGRFRSSKFGSELWDQVLKIKMISAWVIEPARRDAPGRKAYRIGSARVVQALASEQMLIRP
jgi:hypothetical protein